MQDILTTTIAAMCENNKDFADRLTDYEFVEAIVCVYGEAAGFLMTGLMVWGGISIAIYNTTGDVRVPAVLLLLTGGVVLPQMAGVGLTLSVIVLLLTGAGVATVLYYQWSR
jgi:hypothetical protein